MKLYSCSFYGFELARVSILSKFVNFFTSLRSSASKEVQIRALSLGFQELGNQAFSFQDCPFHHSRENSFSDFSIFHFLVLVLILVCCVSFLVSRLGLASIYGSKPKKLDFLKDSAKYYVLSFTRLGCFCFNQIQC